VIECVAWRERLLADSVVFALSNELWWGFDGLDAEEAVADIFRSPRSLSVGVKTVFENREDLGVVFLF
jgi:hypothetical protein